ncbi:hypothetical protein EfmAA96_04850 [Enterococcus faecium]|nr:hypothetical protein EfmAA96_04850 [Enterococcus faecium]
MKHYIFCDPEWTHETFPNGLILFDALHNTAAVLGLRYFGELKTLDLIERAERLKYKTTCYAGGAIKGNSLARTK